MLHHALNKKGDHYNPEGLGLDAPKELAYLNQVTHDYKDRAAEVLQSEFKLWLQGRHPDNDEQEEYNNDAGDGRPKRRYFAVTTDEVREGHYAGQDKNDWISSPWGRTQLTHLHGVRDYLRADAIKADEESFKLNMLAEYGPQTLQDAWIYFKHWVKKRPIDDPLTLTNLDDGYTEHLKPALNKSKGGNIQPDYRAYMRDDGVPEPLDYWPENSADYTYDEDQNEYWGDSPPFSMKTPVQPRTARMRPKTGERVRFQQMPTADELTKTPEGYVGNYDEQTMPPSQDLPESYVPYETEEAQGQSTQSSINSLHSSPSPRSVKPASHTSTLVSRSEYGRTPLPQYTSFPNDPEESAAIKLGRARRGSRTRVATVPFTPPM